jgi:hypothetical protein
MQNMPKNRTQRLTFPKHSNMSAASSTDFVLLVRYTNVSAVDLVIWLAFRLSKARHGVSTVRHIARSDHHRPVLDVWIRLLNPSQKDGTLQPECNWIVPSQICKDARIAINLRYLQKCCIFCIYMPNMQYMQYMLNMHPPIFCIFVAYLLYEHPADPRKPTRVRVHIFLFLHIYSSICNFFWVGAYILGVGAYALFLAYFHEIMEWAAWARSWCRSENSSSWEIGSSACS